MALLASKMLIITCREAYGLLGWTLSKWNVQAG